MTTQKELDELVERFDTLVDEQALLVWRSYIVARQKGEPIPDYVFAYLDRIAEQLEQLTDEPPKQYEKAIADALGLKAARGQQNPFNVEVRRRFEDGLLQLWQEYEGSVPAEEFDKVIARNYKMEQESAAKLRQRLVRHPNSVYGLFLAQQDTK